MFTPTKGSSRVDTVANKFENMIDEVDKGISEMSIEITSLMCVIDDMLEKLSDLEGAKDKAVKLRTKLIDIVRG